MNSEASATRVLIDPRGARFAAVLTTAVLIAAALLLPSTAATVLLLIQGLVFALGVFVGPQATPYAWIFRTVVRPRLGAPQFMEDAAPPRFAQGCGLAFVAAALLGVFLGWTVLAWVALSLAIIAAFLNAAFGLCLGCEIYLLGVRIRSARTT